jgi:hypothetical protein
MTTIKLLTSSNSWEGIYIDDDMFFQDQSISREKLSLLCVEYNSELVEINVDYDYPSNDEFFPENFCYIDESLIIEKRKNSLVDVSLKFKKSYASPMDVQIIDSDDLNLDFGMVM